MKAKLKKLFSRKLTFMLVPHTSFRSFRFCLSFSFLIFLFVSWTGLTVWATLAVMSNLDYWTMKVNHQALKLKVHYFARELKKSRELVDQVRQADFQLRKLLNLKERKAIIETDQREAKSEGGAEPFEQSLLQKELSKTLWQITDEEIRQSSRKLREEAAQSLLSYKELSEQIAIERGLYRSIPYGWPAVGRATSHFGQRISPFHGTPQFHSGIDIANEKDTIVRATADGMVLIAGWEGGYGKLIVIDHGFGYVTYYGHNSKIFVKAGDKVKRGQFIAFMGSSGSSTGNHTHYEIWKNGRAVNPWPYLVARSPEDLRIRAKQR